MYRHGCSEIEIEVTRNGSAGESEGVADGTVGGMGGGHGNLS